MSKEASEATIAMAIARLGGTVEGAPTARHNFLQRIDELRKVESERDAMIEALTPSVGTKAAYIGEYDFELVDSEGNGTTVWVPWTVVKQIMTDIRARAAARTRSV